MKDIIIAREVAQKVSDAGGRAYFVGGFVRDEILGTENKDIDIEVHGIGAHKLREILSASGDILEMGEAFGIFSLKGTDIDVAMPRSERATGRGHRDFDVSVDPYIGTKKAAERRDFTVNSLMKDVLTGEIIDHFGGLKDIENKVLRHVNDVTFPEDPLRVLRLAQFSARFGFTPAEETVSICRKTDVSALSPERVEGELKKALLKSDKPSVFFEVLNTTDALDFFFPEIKALRGIAQNPLYHPEGDVWVHTMQVLDRAVKYRNAVSEPFPFMLSALFHDLGKIKATQVINGVIHAYNHEALGLPIVKAALSRFTKENAVIEYVLNMTKYHMKPGIMARAGSSQKSFNKLFDESISPSDLICLSLSDEGKEDSAVKELLSEKLTVFEKIMSRPFVQGRDLIEAGLTPGRDFSEILAYAHKLRLAGIEKESALRQTLSYAARLKKTE